jgi:general stress protein YciG
MPFTKGSEFAKLAGRVGGNQTKKRLDEDPTYFSRIGTQGGKTMNKKYGKEFYRVIGKHNQQKGKVTTENYKEFVGDTEA